MGGSTSKLHYCWDNTVLVTRFATPDGVGVITDFTVLADSVVSSHIDFNSAAAARLAHLTGVEG